MRNLENLQIIQYSEQIGYWILGTGSLGPFDYSLDYWTPWTIIMLHQLPTPCVMEGEINLTLPEIVCFVLL